MSWRSLRPSWPPQPHAITIKPIQRGAPTHAAGRGAKRHYADGVTDGQHALIRTVNAGRAHERRHDDARLGGNPLQLVELALQPFDPNTLFQVCERLTDYHASRMGGRLDSCSAAAREDDPPLAPSSLFPTSQSPHGITTRSIAQRSIRWDLHLSRRDRPRWPGRPSAVPVATSAANTDQRSSGL